MQVIEISAPGGPEVLRLTERPDPVPAPGEVVIAVAAIGVNRPDIQQRRGLYPPPPGASDLPGLDVAGEIVAAGEGVPADAVGRTVCALTNGGGYAALCAVPYGQCMALPAGKSVVEGAAIPEALFTAWNNVVWLGRLAPGETLLVQGGTSGVGLMAIQVARLLFDARVIATAGSAEKRAVCRDFGAHAAIDYRDPAFAEKVREAAGERGVDIILDAQAGATVQPHLDLLAPDGRLVLIASHLSPTAEVDTRQLVRRRLTLTGSTLRPRDAAYKARLARELEARVWPLLESGAMRLKICATFPFAEMAQAHRLLDENRQVGKVVVLGPEA